MLAQTIVVVTIILFIRSQSTRPRPIALEQQNTNPTNRSVRRKRRQGPTLKGEKCGICWGDMIEDKGPDIRVMVFGCGHYLWHQIRESLDDFLAEEEASARFEREIGGGEVLSDGELLSGEEVLLEDVPSEEDTGSEETTASEEETTPEEGTTSEEDTTSEQPSASEAEELSSSSSSSSAVYDTDTSSQDSPPLQNNSSAHQPDTPNSPDTQQPTETNLRREICAICLGEMENTVLLPECWHPFHYDCLIDWLKRQYSCPTCRREMDLRKVELYWVEGEDQWETLPRQGLDAVHYELVSDDSVSE
ncbi:hypothetical protein QBC40DRAFT_329276 [Triangularia verruculosa]|uniref:RING-type domain-containing protein n=1 Tax=Triangularia verruculosa TaxID=2587418 RepID=A0AAN6XQ70_9PEZI|nr:hypothetical protein QBC40DRAFT_329276 [Triangularia verruculosa]